MTYLFLCIAIIVFIVLIRALRIEQLAGDATAVARKAGATMASKTLDDDEKEKEVQAASLKMLKFFFLITIASAIALGVSIGVAMLGTWLGFYDLGQLIEASVDWRFLIGATVATIGAFWLMR